MADSSRAESHANSSFRPRPSELLRTYVSDPHAPRPEEVQRLLSELDVRQSELEVQNQKLQVAQQQLEAYRDRYIDLYDFAPVGYVTLDEDGYIQEINLAGARLLGGERAELVGYPFADYVVLADRATYLEHIRKCCGQHQDITSELDLITKEGRLLVVQLHSVPVESLKSEGTFGKTAITDITDRKRAEDAIQEERNLLRTLIDNLPDSIYIKDTQGRFVVANLAATRITGATTPSDLLGKTDYDFYPEAVAAEYLSDERGIVRSGEPLVNKDEPHLDPQGNPRTVLTTKVALKDSRGAVIGIVGISHDITDRKRTEEALQESEEQLRMVMRASSTGWWDWDLKSKVLRLDDQCKTLLGVSLTANVTYEGVRERLRAEDRLRFDQTLASTLGESGEHEVECAVDWSDGSVHWALFRGCAIRDAAGIPLRLMGVAVDTTCRRRAEEALRESEQFYRTLIETLPVTVVLADSMGRVSYISPAAKEMFDLAPGEGLGTAPIDWIAPEHHEVVRERMRQVLVDLRPQPPIEYKMFKRDRTPVWAQVASAPVLDNEGGLKGVVTVCLDITARRQVEQALRENETRLRLAQQAAGAGTWDLDLVSGQVIVSEETWGLWGATPRAPPESFDWLAAVHPEDRSLAETTFRQAMQHAGDARCEYRILWPDGQVRWHHARGRTLADREGRPLRLVGITTDITERKQAEERVRETGERLRLAIRGAEMGWWDWDLLGGEMTADDQCKALWGLPPTAQPSYELTMALTHPEDRTLLQQRLQEVLEATTERDVEFRTVWSNGTVHWLLARGRAFRDDHGTPVRLVGLVMDVSARKHAEEALRESETRFRAIYEQAPLGIALINSLTGQFLQINPKYREIIQRNEEEMRKLTFQSITHPEDLQADLDNMARLIEGKSRLFNMEKRLIRGDGSLIWVSLTVMPMWEEGEPPRSHIAIIEDITEWKRTEESLRESQERWRLALEAAELGWWSWDFAAGVVEGDEKTKSLIGSPAPAVPLRGILERTHPDDRAWLRTRTAELQSRAGNYELEFRVVWPDGSIHWVSVRGRSFANADGKPARAVGIATEITARKQAEAELAAAKASAEEAKEAAEHANRAKDHFLAVLSHELRTPLTPVVMGVSMLQDRPDLDPGTREMLESVRRNIEMEVHLIDDLLDVTRIARGKIELNRSPVELCTVIQRAVEVCKPDIEARRLEFGVDMGPSAPYWVEADVPRLQQVFWNLLRNAVKFTPPGGCVGIRCRRNEDYVVVEVNDCGIGIEPEALSRIFDAFEQVEQSITRQFGGLGLGLAISKALVEMHGGQIEAHSAGKGKGATFRVRLPLTVPAGRPVVATPVAVPRCAVRPLRILLVEDHGVTAKVMRMMLTAEGHAVEMAGDVATALEMVNRQEFDLLMSDLGLPDGSGHDLMRQIRQRGHKFPAIALSGYGQDDDIKRSHEVGFSAHLTKPAPRDAVVAAIASVTAANVRTSTD